MSRRDIRFQSLDQVLDDLNLLESKGYTACGKWDLSQIAEHLSDWMTYPLDGFPKMPLVIGWLVGAMRVIQGKQLYRKFVAQQRMATGQPTSPSSVHSPRADAGPSLQRLRKCIERLRQHRGSIIPSPLFGAMNHDELIALQLAHCAHHLSFLTPNP